MSVDTLELNELIARCAAEDETALAQLYELTSPQLYGIALKLFQQKALAEKVLQDTYVRIWHNAGMYQSGRGSVMNWLIGSLRYTAIGVLRHMNTEGQILHRQDFELLDEAGYQALLQRLADSGADNLVSCFKTMEKPRVLSLLLAYYYGLDVNQLSVLLDEDVETIAQWLQQDLQDIKKALS